MIEIINTDFEYADQRGKLVKLVHNGYEQVNLLRSNKGVIRGGHYHKVAYEAFYIVEGSVLVKCRKGEEVNQWNFLKGDFFKIEPFVIHEMHFPEDCLMVQMYSVPVEQKDGSKDIFAAEI